MKQPLLIALVLCVAVPALAGKPLEGPNIAISNGATFNIYKSDSKRFTVGGKTIGAEDMIANVGYNLNLRIGYNFFVAWRFYIAVEAHADYTQSKIKGVYKDAVKAAGLSTKAHGFVATGGARFSIAAMRWLIPWFSTGLGYGFIAFNGENSRFSAEKFGGGFGYHIGVGIDFVAYKILLISPVFRFHHFFYKAKSDGLFGEGRHASLSLMVSLQF